MKTIIKQLDRKILQFLLNKMIINVKKCKLLYKRHLANIWHNPTIQSGACLCYTVYSKHLYVLSYDGKVYTAKSIKSSYDAFTRPRIRLHVYFLLWHKLLDQINEAEALYLDIQKVLVRYFHERYQSQVKVYCMITTFNISIYAKQPL